MIKGLEALNYLKRRFEIARTNQNELNIIEKELKAKDNLASMCDNLAKLVGLKEKDYVELETLITKKLKALEQLEIMYSNCVIEGAKQKKALKIIKEKKVNVGEFLVLINKDTTYEQYEYLYENRDKILGDSLTTFNAKLSKREFEVIKESMLCH